MATNGYSIKIGVTGDAAKGIAKINKSLEALNKQNQKSIAPYQAWNKELKKFTDLTGINKLAGAFRGLEGAALDVTKAIGPLGAAIAGLGSAASLTGIVKLTESAATLGNTLYVQSRQLNMSVQQLDNFRQVALVSGTSVDAMTSSLASFNQVLQDTASGRNQNAMRILQNLGLNAGTAFRGKNSAQMLKQTLDAISGSGKTIQVQEEIANQLGLGSLIPLLVQGKDAIDSYFDAASKLQKPTDAQVKSSHDLVIQQGRLQAAYENTSYQIGSVFTPYLIQAESELTKLVTYAGQHPNWAAGIIAGITLLGTAMTVLPAIAFLGNIKSIASSMKVLAGSTEAAAAAQTELDAAQAAGGGSGWVALTSKVTAYGAAIVGAYYAAQKLAGFINGSLASSGVSPSDVDLTGEYVPDSGSSDGSANSGFGTGALGKHYSALMGNPINFGTVSGGNNGAGGSSESANAIKAVKYFTGQGWSQNQAEGIVQNLMEESGLNPGARGDSGNAVGLAQWHSDRVAAIKSGAGIDVTTAGFDDQLKAVQWELTHTESKAGNILKQTSTVADATGNASLYYERPRAQMTAANNRAADSMAPGGIASIMAGTVNTNIHVKVDGTAKVTTSASGVMARPKVKVSLPGAGLLGHN